MNKWLLNVMFVKGILLLVSSFSMASSTHIVLLDSSLVHYQPFLEKHFKQQVLASLPILDSDYSKVFIKIFYPHEHPFHIMGKMLSRNDVFSSHIKAFHLISHGSDGELHYHQKKLTSRDLIKPESLEAFLKLKQRLSEPVSLYLYACELAASPKGRRFVNLLAYLTGLSVLASDNVTGHEALGGDWVLEYQATYRF